jgi:hypothetical protein
MSALSQWTLDETLSHPEIWGRWVESAIGAHLMNNLRTEDFSLFYWRERNDEIDFVIRRKGKIIGIEVKSSYGMAKKGMDAFQKTFSPEKILLVGKEGLPIENFLRINPADLFA